MLERCGVRRIVSAPFSLLCTLQFALFTCLLSAADLRLIDAVKAGDRAAIRALIAQGVDVNGPEPDGTTALHWAAESGDLETVRALLKASANARVANRNRITPLSLAASNGSAAMIAALLAAGADVNVRLPQGQTALMMAARGGHAAAVERLLTAGAGVNAREDRLGETALIWAAAENHADVVKVLVAHGADVNLRSRALTFPRQEFGDGKSGRLTVLPKGDWVPLMYAARQNSAAAIRALSASGADLNAVDPDKMTALLVAVINAHYDAAALLLELGADPNLADAAGMTPLYAAVDLNTFADTPGRPTPMPSGKLRAVDVVKALIAHGADPNLPLSEPILARVHDRGDGSLGAGATALMRAAKKGDIEMMRVLVANGADPKLRTKAGAEALMYAAGLGGAGRFTIYEERQATEADFIEAARLCLDPGADVNASNPAGQTALHLAVTARAEAFVRFLLGRGARVDVKDKQGRTPLDLAMGAGGRGRGGEPPVIREDVVALLRQSLSQ
jgi:ankyrin repeat protein